MWTELRDAIRGTSADYTKIPLRRAVLLLAVPMVLELVLESTFAVVDIWFVAKLGPSAVATVGLTETFLFLLYAIGMGLAMATTAVVARRVGEGKRDEAAVTAMQAIWIALLVSVPCPCPGRRLNARKSCRASLSRSTKSRARWPAMGDAAPITAWKPSSG